MSSSFPQLGVPAELVTVLAARAITWPTPIQELSLPAALAGRDVAGRAPTGSGKTLAFGIPLAVRSTRARVARPRALVLAPTRELAAQIAESLQPLLVPNKRSIATFYGGVSETPQLKVLRRGVDIVVGCPGRIGDLVRRGVMILDEVEIVVLDEADRMADMGFLPEVRRLLDATPRSRQTLLFSATLDGAVDVLVRNYQRDPERCEVSPEPTVDRMRHLVVDTPREQRLAATAQLVDEHGSTVVFCRTKHGADRVARQLSKFGVAAVAIHGNRTQPQRDRALAAFSDGRATALVATDIAARGIHVDDVRCVIHFDAPDDDKAYVHRSGRTARAGAEGTVVTFRDPAERQASAKPRVQTAAKPKQRRGRR
ncbi:MAG TPA: DEAD/DEAH box helicase [Acidimicrobiales bacterium]|nr:DEAD/DEAH box helicase [Acidimicrobiales bacterium]